jgi:AcrR family transcriptional regulator
MKDIFFKIEEEKKKRILECCIAEFATHNYEQSSINAIIKAANISKGGLFKYISCKEDLYLYTMEVILTELIIYQAEHVTRRTNCYFDRIIELTEVAFEFYEHHNASYKAILTGLLDRRAPVYDKLLGLRDRLVKAYQSDILDDIDWTGYRINKEALIFVMGCTLNGYNLELLDHMNNQTASSTFRDKLVKDLSLIFDVMKVGVMNEVSSC